MRNKENSFPVHTLIWRPDATVAKSLSLIIQDRVGGAFPSYDQDEHAGAMNRQICNFKPEDVAKVRSSQLLAKLDIEDLALILREKASLVWTCEAGLEENTEETNLETLRAAADRF